MELSPDRVSKTGWLIVTGLCCAAYFDPSLTPLILPSAFCCIALWCVVKYDTKGTYPSSKSTDPVSLLLILSMTFLFETVFEQRSMNAQSQDLKQAQYYCYGAFFDLGEPRQLEEVCSMIGH